MSSEVVDELTTTKIWRVHRDVFPYTDHGCTWVEFAWFENQDGERITPITPVAGGCERLSNLPGGPIPVYDIDHESNGELYRGPVNSETIHDEWFYKVGNVSIVPISKAHG